MELRSRSSRSRSNTPSSLSQFEQQEGFVTQSVRVTRSKVKTYEESQEEFSGFETILSPIEESMDKRVLKKRFVTSDYSSDDGDNEVSSSLQNFKNQTIENTSTTKVNGELSALKVYRQAGEYWNKYPKTDYTYSHHSKDRVEISPGVIQMPNMSRNSIHKSPVTNTSPNVQFIANKACSTDSFLGTTSSTQDYSTETILRPRNLFSTSSRTATNNNTLNGDGYKQHHYSSSSSSSRYSREKASVVVRIWRYFLTWTYFLYEVQSQSTLWAMKRFYRFACWVLLMDRWLLTRTSSRVGASSAMNSMERRDDGKIKKLLALCGIPLLILGGWFLFWGLASLFSNRPVEVKKIIVLEDSPPNHPNFQHQSGRLNAADIASALTQEQLLIISENINNIVNINNNDNSDLLEKLLQNPNFLGMVTDRLKENIDIEAMKAKAVENLHEEQTLKHNTYSEKEILDQLLQNPILLNIIKNTNKDSMKNQEALNQQFQDQIQNLRLGLAADSKAEFHRFEHQLRRCCRNSLIATEKYVLDILKNIFQAPNSLNQADFSHWLRTVFVARDDLETRLGNLTASLSEKHNAMIEENGRLLMDEVALRLREHALLEDIDYERITAQLREELQTGTSSITKVTHEDEYIKRIVKTVLEIYDADKTGLVDYALQSSGAEVLSTKCTEPYHRSFAVMSVFGVPLWHLYKPPHTVLTPNVNPGECWAFQSFPGYMVIKLTHRIHVEAISYEHVNKLLIPDGRIDSAPNKFSVYGVEDPDDNKNEPLLLGEYVYDVNGDPLQFFIVQSNYTGETPAFSYVELRVNTNHGNPNYTCLYRLRIHGKLAAIDHPS